MTVLDQSVGLPNGEVPASIAGSSNEAFGTAIGAAAAVDTRTIGSPAATAAVVNQCDMKFPSSELGGIPCPPWAVAASFYHTWERLYCKIFPLAGSPSPRQPHESPCQSASAVDVDTK